MKMRRRFFAAAGSIVLAGIAMSSLWLASQVRDLFTGRYRNSAEVVERRINLAAPGGGTLSVNSEYLTPDDLTTVTAWYAGWYGIEPGRGIFAQGQCLRLSQVTGYLVAHRTIAIMLCAAPAGTRIYFNQVIYPGP